MTKVSRIQAYGLLATAVCLFACGTPRLEGPDCSAARGAVKEFYSFHFGNDMRSSRENLARRAKFLTPEFAAELERVNGGGDIFTVGTDDIPKTFRVGACYADSAGTARLEVLLFWRDDVRSEQRRIYVDAADRGGKWLIDSISGQ